MELPKCGSIAEVVLPPKRDMRVNHFGFVRFKKKDEGANLEKSLQNVWIGWTLTQTRNFLREILLGRKPCPAGEMKVVGEKMSEGDGINPVLVKEGDIIHIGKGIDIGNGKKTLLLKRKQSEKKEKRLVCSFSKESLKGLDVVTRKEETARVKPCCSKMSKRDIGPWSNQSKSGEHTREGNDLYMEMKESGVINEQNIAESKVALVYGQMNESPEARMRVGLTALTMVEYFRDVNEQDVLLFIDNIFCFVQPESEVSALLGRMPSSMAVDPLDSTSTMLQPRIVGEEHYETAQRVKQTLQRYKELQDIIAILGLDELSEKDRLIVARA
ncbi:unnamed protein product [Lupinus luteus]|uniref:H(+)-transporting two-sector ATPase n=1 Tax=Lupinus luteus TaxID=3873 RepID=A0AAV1Y5B0_LUPLU